MVVSAQFRVFTLFLCLYAATALAGTSLCAPVSENAVTFHGNEDIVISMAHVMRSPRGFVKAPDDSLVSGVLVEVFDHPEVVLRGGPPPQGVQHRIAACMTGEKGSFDLKLASGN